MPTVTTLSLSARVTLNLHSLNNERTEGNYQQTRMVHILDGAGERAVVNAISGDMFKRILVEHLVPLLDAAGQPLSAGAKVLDADRITTDAEFIAFCDSEQEFIVNGKTEKRMPLDSEVLTKILTDCSLTDIAGALVTRARSRPGRRESGKDSTDIAGASETGGRSVGRKSVVEFGWVVGIPEKTTTEQYFHVKYAPEGRQAATGGDTVAGKQAVFHRPASSGQYALICSLELNRIGVNDITRMAVVPKRDREARARALINALVSTLVSPRGAQRNTQNPHIVACEGIVATSSTSLPAPLISPLSESYREEVESTAEVLNRIEGGAVRTMRFDSMAQAVSVLQTIADHMELPEG